jgi:hypothetical protein
MILNANEAYFANSTSYKRRLDAVDLAEQYVAAPGNVRISLSEKTLPRKFGTVVKYQRKSFIEAS